VTDKMVENKSATSGRGFLLAVVVVSLLGLGSSVYLSVLHWQVHSLPGHVSFCAISEEVNCDTVSISRYSDLFGVPVSTWAIFFYVLLIVLSLWGFFAKRSPFPWGLVGVLNVGALAATTFLFLVSEFIIQAFCIMCISLYFLNIVTGVLSVFGQRKAGFSAGSAVNLLLIGLLSGAGIFAGLFSMYVTESVLFFVLVGIILLAVLALVLKGRLRGEREILGRLKQDILHFFKPIHLGAGLILLAAALVVAVLVVTPRLYPEKTDTIAGGLKDISSGHTSDGHNWIGAENPELVIVEYSDYECPFCSRAHSVIRQIVREKKDWLRLVHVHVPLDHTCNKTLRKPKHRHACDCSRAAICADHQNYFWQMNDLLFNRRGGLDAKGLVMLAESMGMNARQFRDCMAAEETEQKLQGDLQECRTVALECREMGKRFGTPTFTVGGQVVVGAKKRPFWLQLVDRLRKKNQSQPTE
jgi:uncharacterized membrane protein/protein-disulfide isomerase